MNKINHIGVIGSGAMGNGIAHVFGISDYKVFLIDLDKKILNHAMETILKNMKRQVSKGLISESDMNKGFNNISINTNMQSLSDVDIVIEAVSENETIKSRYRDEFTYDSFSEGEKMRIDLALLFTWRAVAKLKNSVNTNLLILDEVFDSSLDAAGTDEFLKILYDLAGNVNVFVISHKGEILYDKFDTTIKFEKYKNFSRIV